MGASPDPPFSVCYAGGGTFGIAWHLAVTAALVEVGLDPAGAPLVGTSAGAWAAPAAKLGLGVEDFEALVSLRIPDPRPGALWRAASALFGPDTRAAGVSVAAVELPTMRRRIFDAAVHPVADLAAASSAVPGLFAPHRVGGRFCIDGGVRSMASIDAAPPVRLLVVSLPVAGGLLGPVGRTLEVTSRRMVRRWRVRHGGVDVVIRPSRDVVALVGPDPRALFDTTLARDVYPVCLDAARRRLAHHAERVAAALGAGPAATGARSGAVTVATTGRPSARKELLMD